MSTEVILVAGTACEAKKFALFRKLATMASGQGYSVSFINGVEMRGAAPTAATPERQKELIRARTEEPENEYVLVGHCLGSLAVVDSLAESNANSRGVLISPPLPNPYNVILHPFSRDRKQVNAVSMSMKSGTHARGVEVTPEFFDQVFVRTKGFASNVARLNEEGVLDMICPDSDWNAECSLAVNGMCRVQPVEGTHSLSDASEATMKTIYQALELD